MRPEDKKASRRVIQDGFPLVPHPLTAAEVDGYFTTTKITCLLCGNEYKALSAHLATMHATSTEEYRFLYGLPWTLGLICPSTRQLLSAHGEERVKRLAGCEPPNYKPRKHPIQPFAREKLAARSSARMAAFHAWSRAQRHEN